MTIKLSSNEIRDAIFDYLANNHDHLVFEEAPEIKFELNGTALTEEAVLVATVEQVDEEFTEGPYR